MGYTNITHGYKIRDELKPHCEECDQEVTVERLIWQCTVYNSQRRRNSITKDLMGENNEETGRLLMYLKETGLLYSI
jgi:adenylate kinase family enzyme